MRSVFACAHVYHPAIIYVSKQREKNMNTFEKILSVLAKNLGYTVVLVVAIVLFAIFSGGLLRGVITAGSALIGYVCITLLYKEYKTAAPAPAPAKKSKKK